MRVYKKYRKGRKRGGQRYHTKTKVKKKLIREFIFPFATKPKKKLTSEERILYLAENPKDNQLVITRNYSQELGPSQVLFPPPKPKRKHGVKITRKTITR